MQAGPVGRPGISPLRFGLGPLGQGLGLSPAVGAISGGGVPVGRRATAAGGPTDVATLLGRGEPQDIAQIQRLVDAGLVPPAVLAALLQSGLVQGPPAARAASAVAPSQAPAGPSAEGGGAPEALALAKQGLGAAKTLLRGADLGHDLLVELGIVDPAAPMSPETRQAFDLYREGERTLPTEPVEPLAIPGEVTAGIEAAVPPGVEAGAAVPPVAEPAFPLSRAELSAEVAAGGAPPSDVFNPDRIGGAVMPETGVLPGVLGAVQAALASGGGAAAPFVPFLETLPGGVLSSTLPDIGALDLQLSQIGPPTAIPSGVTAGIEAGVLPAGIEAPAGAGVVPSAIPTDITAAIEAGVPSAAVGAGSAAAETGAAAAARLGAQGLGDVGALSPAATGVLSGVLEAIPYLGALLGVGQTIAGNEPDLIKALDSLAYAAAPFTFGITAALPMVAEVTGLKDLIRDVPHEVREARELSRYGVGASGLVKNILASQDFPSLYSTLLEHQTGYVGGTSPQAVDIGFPGRDYLGLYQQAQPWSTEDFFQAVRERPEELRANVQAGVNPSMLDPLNIGIARAVRSKVSELDALGRITQQLPAIQQQTQLADVNARDVLDAAIQAQSRGIAASSPEFIELLRSGYTTRQAQETAAR